MKIIYGIYFIALATLKLSACNKNIKLPNPDLGKLFGKWEWVQSSGGFAGKTTNPSSLKHTKSIEFLKNGIYRQYQDGKVIEKRMFSIVEDKSIFSKKKSYIIKYTNLESKTDYAITQSVNFGGSDSLFLNDECWDCFKNVYIRK